MRLRAVAGAAVALVALTLVRSPEVIAVNPSPCPSPVAASGARTCGGTDLYAALTQRLSGDLRQALSTQRKLAAAVDDATSTYIALSGQLAAEEARVADLQNQIAQLDAQISALESRIEVERQQVSALARAMYQRPATLLDLIASSGNLSDVLSQATGMLIAGQRAHALEDQLKSNLAQVQADRDARQSDLDQENATMQEIQAGLAQLSGVQTELNSLANQQVALIQKIRTATTRVGAVPADVSTQLAQLLEAQETNLAAQAEAATWAQASVGAGMATDQNMLPSGVGPTAGGGIPMAWPMRAGAITQGFGPTMFVLEPPLGPYPHFHTGIDLAAPVGTPVNSAAAGIVIVVAHSAVGYGNYVIVAHGYGVLTLYGHLLETDAYPGEAVTQGQQIGREGMTGFATGPHVHFEVRINGQFVNPARFLPPI